MTERATRADELVPGDVFVSQAIWYEVVETTVRGGAVEIVLEIRGWGNEYRSTWTDVPDNAAFAVAPKTETR